MKNTNRIISIAVSAMLSVSAIVVLNACAKKDTVYVESEHDATIVYDNRNLGYVAEKDTAYELVLAKGVLADVTATAATATAEYPDGYSPKGKVDIGVTYTEVELAKVAKWNKDTMTLTAVAEGKVTLTLSATSGKVLDTVTVDIEPAYVTNPYNEYTMTNKDYATSTSALMGWTHDPSLIEVQEDNGLKAYYMLSTGWETGNEIRKSYDLVHWKYMGKTFNAATQMTAVDEWLQSKEYHFTPSWWAPDIVADPNGGYWLYTCVVDGSGDNEGIPLDGDLYSKACIVLFHSDTMDAESFEYVGVLMQSCIPRVGGGIDVNSIDPQIIYTEDGRMFMAYGSFGTGNYILELNPKTGLRKDKFYKNGKFLDWKVIRQYRDEATDMYNNFKNTDEDEDGEKIGWTHEFYGKNISRGAMEAPVIARHDNVAICDDNGEVTSVQTYYYSMHSFDGLATNYSMWGGRTTEPDGIYRSVKGQTISNTEPRTGNQYMSAFIWEDKAETAIDIILPGHNDLFTTDNGKNIAAYITRTSSYRAAGVSNDIVFMVQTHQYFLNSKGDICINANRYGGETARSVSEKELLAFTKDNTFKLVKLTGVGGSQPIYSEYVKLNDDHTVTGVSASNNGTWAMFGDNYIKITLQNDTYYGVVAPTWLDDQQCFGFTITSMGQRSGYAMFMNAVSTEA